jgi:hydrogenase nickel incorporation protein HypA/HybF
VHELEFTRAVVATVLQQTGEARVATVRLRIGRRSGLVPDAVRFCFDAVADGTPVAGARLEIDEEPVVGTCDRCGADFAFEDLLLGCPCGSLDVHAAGGNGLMVTAVERA